MPSTSAFSSSLFSSSDSICGGGWEGQRRE